MAVFFRLILPLCFLAFIVPAVAEDVMILDRDNRAVVSGQITDVRNNEGIFTLNNNGTPIDVGISDLDLERGTLDFLLQEGSYVTVEGNFESGDVLEAKKVVRSDDPVIVEEGVIINETANSLLP